MLKTCTKAALALAVAMTVASPALAAKPTKPLPTETYGNNLSTPVIFAEGTGLTGLPTAEDTGLRGGIVPSLTVPYLYNGATYYLQATENTWQADCANGAATGEVIEADWSDNLTRQTWNTGSVIRVEVVLAKPLATPLNGFEMAYLYGTGTSEVWGTTGVKVPANLATVYSACARLTIQKLTGQGGSVVGTLYDSAVYERYGVDGTTNAYAAEVNVSGKAIYGFNWDLAKFDMASIGLPTEPKAGWYRLSFGFDPLASYSVTDASGNTRSFSVPCNSSIGSLNPLDLLGTTVPEVVQYPPKLVSPALTSLEIYVKPSSGKK